MNPRILLEVLKDKRVQSLIKLSVILNKDSPKEDIIELLKQELSTRKEGPSRWIQSEFELS